MVRGLEAHQFLLDRAKRLEDGRDFFLDGSELGCALFSCFWCLVVCSLTQTAIALDGRPILLSLANLREFLLQLLLPGLLRGAEFGGRTAPGIEIAEE